MTRLLIINISISFLMCFTTLSLFAGSDVQVPTGGRGNGMGNASVALSDFWAIQNNQAGLASFQSVAASFYYQNRFLISELGLKSFGFTLPTRNGTFGLSYQNFGYTQYHETKVGLAFGKSFGERFSAGLQIDYLAYKLTGEYGQANLLTFELGIQHKISEKVVIGAHAFNPIRAKLSNDPEERVPSVFRLGAAFNVSEELVLVLETEKNLDYKPNIRTGLEYKLAEKIFARVGYESVPALTGSENLNISSQYSFGFGLCLGALEVDFAAQIHQTLGWSPSLSMIYRFTKPD